MQTTGLVDVGAVKLYAEVVGAGPTLMFITGASGDAGEWSEIARMLADDFTVLTYNRRGMSRSPCPKGWTATSIAEQADDAADLLRTLELASALVVGHSGGGSITCELLARHPEVVAHAVVFEPPLFRRYRAETRSPRRYGAQWSRSCASAGPGRQCGLSSAQW
jgi:pimeloyl-ACP methyl ester carboxylesterase